MGPAYVEYTILPNITMTCGSGARQCGVVVGSWALDYEQSAVPGPAPVLRACGGVRKRPGYQCTACIWKRQVQALCYCV